MTQHLFEKRSAPFRMQGPILIFVSLLGPLVAACQPPSDITPSSPATHDSPTAEEVSLSPYHVPAGDREVTVTRHGELSGQIFERQDAQLMHVTAAGRVDDLERIALETSPLYIELEQSPALMRARLDGAWVVLLSTARLEDTVDVRLDGHHGPWEGERSVTVESGCAHVTLELTPPEAHPATHYAAAFVFCEGQGMTRWGSRTRYASGEEAVEVEVSPL